MSKQTLNGQNQKWLWLYLALNWVVLTAIFSGGALDPDALSGEWNHFTQNAMVTTVAPLATLVLSRLIPSKWKEIFLFWRLEHTLPGHRAFSKYAPADPRIDLKRLEKKLRPLPQSPGEQNTVWYGLLKKHERKPLIRELHRQRLLLRDMASLALLLLVGYGLTSLMLVTTVRHVLIGILVMLAQFVIVLFAARNTAERLVTTVLAQESHSGSAPSTPEMNRHHRYRHE